MLSTASVFCRDVHWVLKHLYLANDFFLTNWNVFNVFWALVEETRHSDARSPAFIVIVAAN